MKICCNCKLPKDLSEFSNFTRGKDGKAASCKKCSSEYFKLWKEKRGAEAEKERRRLEYLRNIEKITASVKKYRASHKQEFKDYMREYVKRKSEEDPIFKLRRTMRSRLLCCLKSKNIKKLKNNIDYLGISLEEFKIYIQNQFTSEMSWNNHGKVWHLDHILPLKIGETEEEIMKLFYYKNFQPLLIQDNLKKSFNYDKQQFKKFKTAGVL